MKKRQSIKNILEFNNRARSKSKTDKEKTSNTLESINAVYDGRKLTYNAFKSKLFPLKPTQRKGLKILTSKQMLQMLAIALAQVKAGNTSENLLNEIRQIIYSLYWAKEITKKVYNNIMNSINLSHKMDTTFMNSENSKTSDPQRLLLNLSDR